ncbi:D-2-hydroxyacid dehydrogenase [Shewanella sp. SR44-3]|uniref:D-2-hydroxyacid dehydrogenase n=1 Tax=unclassified Shewanella TaxID=196818 RepID=UPI0015F8BACC|nr:D-2-hydroxyacid dehydrogenase [Shewanella sp. SR44-3]MBB1268683.1 D-2-hydroxyacid dehydrogenase [Shewanella sp. SR44-3]
MVINPNINTRERLVVLDGFSLNPGDLSWQPLAALCDLSVYERSSTDDLLRRCQGASMLLTNKTPINAALMAMLPELKYIGILATGTNVVDLEAARLKGIVVTNVPAYGPDAVAQMVFAHILHHSQQVALHHQAVKAGLWCQSEDFCFSLTQLGSLKGKHLGLVGFGNIAEKVAKIALAFEMKVSVNRQDKTKPLPDKLNYLSLEALLSAADIISLHCPLTPVTHHLINPQRLKLIKPNALLINTARGDLIDESALASALNGGRLFAGVDVLSTEPPKVDNPLLRASNISITPHIGWATFEARQNLLNIAIDNVAGFLQAKIRNRVS